ncbi:MAG: alpha/beta hydrolase [Hyphomicrobium sp.]|uniref:alpha/beta hydrolase n=1 Tax=Hyphomicrobium sp. TaxID=82 RepID=UPI001323820C|nr:alpha/beta hydrolase [Hyphomicrobium sp.]KAB2939739.1 MAG: alpha/beta hydrolase [Hyphomicrobium sp.]MBZ0210436.1 alpha/beta hydrolase [Hyphomicrobium sp.]
MQLIVKLAYGLFALYAVVAVAAFVLQRRLMYFPDPERVAPASFNLQGVKERVIDAPDGVRLVSWYAPAAPGQPTLLYFHGNAGNLASRSERVRRFIGRGYGVLFLSYRGYGGSTGSPSERTNVADARLAYETLIKDGIEPDDIIVYGESLGSGVAVQLAADNAVGGLVLDAPYTSIVDVAALAYPYLPVRPFMFDRYETMRHLPRVKAPLLVMHGEDDRVIPVDMGKAIYAAAKAPKEIVTFPRAGHSDHHLYGSYDELFRWVDALRARMHEPDARIEGAAQ